MSLINVAMDNIAFNGSELTNSRNTLRMGYTRQVWPGRPDHFSAYIGRALALNYGPVRSGATS